MSNSDGLCEMTAMTLEVILKSKVTCWNAQSSSLSAACPGRGPSGDASVCCPDRSAVRTPGGPGPHQGGFSQCLCRTARDLGEPGARVLLGARLLGAALELCWCPGDDCQDPAPSSAGQPRESAGFSLCDCSGAKGKRSTERENMMSQYTSLFKGPKKEDKKRNHSLR